LKEQKKVFYCSAGVMILSLALGAIFELEWDRYFITWQSNCLTGHRDFVINIMIGICSGSLLSVCTSWINYSSEKEKFIVEFSNLVEDFYTICDKLQYLYICGDADLLAAYYREECANKKMPGASERHVARDSLLKSYKRKDPKCSGHMRLLEDIDTVDGEMGGVIEGYYAVSNFDFSKVERILKKKAFILSNSRREKQIEAVYDYIKKLYSDITDKVGYWREFDAKYNLIVEICRFQPQVFDDVERHGNMILLPPRNRAVEEIKELLSTLS